MSYTIHVQKGGLKDQVEVVLLPLFEEDLKKTAIWKEYDSATGGALAAAIGVKDFEAAPKTVAMFQTVGTQNYARVLLVGLGARAACTPKLFSDALAIAFKHAQKRKVEKYALALPATLEKKIGGYGLGLRIAKTLSTATYHFEDFLTKDDVKLKTPTALTILGAIDAKKVARGLEEGQILGEAVNFSRELGNQPANHMTPMTLAGRVVAACKGLPIKVRVLERDEMERLGMGGMLAVSQGSTHEPAFVVMEYQGGAKKQAPTVWCGKGITFDSGGISIKPSASMEEMKFDMMGAAAVAGGCIAIAKLELPVNVVGILACAENLPSGTAMRPGDIIKAMNGKTIEVVNTDAEGRLVLADALSYAGRYKPRQVIDMATLTGACVVALGNVFSGLFTEDNRLALLLKRAGEVSGDRVWELPVTPEYTEHIKSSVADMKNVGQRGEAGASSAAAFLKEFTDYPWAHIDIAGAAWHNGETGTLHCGATGFGVHLMVEMSKM